MSAEVICKAEEKQSWNRYFDLSSPEIGELIGIQNADKLVRPLTRPQFPEASPSGAGTVHYEIVASYRSVYHSGLMMG